MNCIFVYYYQSTKKSIEREGYFFDNMTFKYLLL